MGRNYDGDRARHRWNGRLQRWEIVVHETVDGRRTKRCVLCPPATSEAAAVQAAAELTADLRAKRLHLPRTWDEGVEAYHQHRREMGDEEDTIETSGYRLKAVGRTLSAPDPLRLTAAQGLQHRNARLAAPRSPVTVNAELSEVRMMQGFFLKRGWIEKVTWTVDDVTPASTKKVKPRAHLRPGEVGPWLTAAFKRGDTTEWELWPAAAILLLHGLRTGEMRTLSVGDLDLWSPVTIGGYEQNIVVAYVEDSKTPDGVRPVPIVSELACVTLRRAFQGRPADEPCFWAARSRSSTKRSRLPKRTEWFRYRAKLTCEDAGIARSVSTHGLRHSTGTLLVSLPGVDYYGAGKALGHSDPSITDKVYAHAALAPRLGPMSALGTFLDRVAPGVDGYPSKYPSKAEEADPRGSASSWCERGDSNPHRHIAH
ncbi:MAG: hypothetical protein EP329_14950 [Deltaproteobacteria bacterium]|nr:MAG: hypothetical protein EP329_14950 [Deltaproteobacteria bacterium]